MNRIAFSLVKSQLAGLAGGGAGNAPAGLGTNAADVIELIQTTIDPFSWDVNGGPGSIMPFAP